MFFGVSCQPRLEWKILVEYNNYKIKLKMFFLLQNFMC